MGNTRFTIKTVSDFPRYNEETIQNASRMDLMERQRKYNHIQRSSTELSKQRVI